MQIFDRDLKINFVDENNVFLGYDLQQDCCEHADWFIADTEQEQPLESGHGDYGGLKDFVFDTGFIKEIKPSDCEDGGMAIFRITNGVRERFIHIYNSHNGYYGHGFEFGISQEVKRAGTL